ncbi:hypothetical protein BD626DRAFT_482044 [Schizophyllum amplum]|uniref:Protein SYM1 n=1 Tax=Schizophyllum amplum TaxID=97359 RepID=A0A550CUS6_9AGAR|nr:hypothetical protein BD626DRAFT_482044 [Auriculariopsis ampla]
MASLFRAYNSALIRRPFLTQCASAATLFGAGDVVAQQWIEKKGTDHDFLRTARLGFYGGCLFGPPIVMWFNFLNKLKFANATTGVVARTAIDQGMMSPIAITWFFGWMSTLEGKPSEAPEKLKSAFVPTLLRNWAVFVPVQILNFSVVPPQGRFVFVSIVNLFWNTYLSAVNAQQKALLDQEQKARDLVPGTAIVENIKG